MAKRRKVVKSKTKSVKSGRAKYTDEELKAALDEIKKGASFNFTSKKYNIPRTTLIYKIKGIRPSKKCRPGPQCVLGNDTERDIVVWMTESVQKGVPITRNALKFSIKKLVEEGKLEVPFKNKVPGRKWIDNFKARHPEITERKAEYIHKGRSTVNENNIRSWFDEVKKELGDNFIDVLNDPKRVFNMDETSMLLHPKRGVTFAAKIQKDIYDVGTSSDKASLTVLVTANAVGDIAPPLVLYDLERISTAIKSHVPKSSPIQWSLGRTKSGWMNAESFFEYFVNVFYPYLRKKKTEFPVIVFLDGHKSHSSIPLSQFCRDNGIILVKLFPNATHILQPLDVSFFGPLKTAWRDTASQHVYNVGISLEKHEVIPKLDAILRDEKFKSNLVSGFKTCGLYPFNPNAVHYEKCIETQSVQRDSEIVQTPSNQTSKSREFLDKLESKLPNDILIEFIVNFRRSSYNGPQEYAELFKIWKEEKSLIDEENYGSTFEPNIADESQMIINFSNPENGLTNEINDYVDGYQNNEEEYQMEISFPELEFNNQDDFVLDSNFHSLPHSTPVKNGKTNGLDISSILVNVSETNSECNAEDIQLTVPITTEILHSSSTEIITNSEKAVPEVENLSPSTENSHLSSTQTIIDSENDKQTAENSNSSSISASSSRSVKQILESAIMYPCSTSKTKKSNRLKERRPCVLTSDTWIELELADAKEKEELERKKEERKEIREKKALEKKNELKEKAEKRLKAKAEKETNTKAKKKLKKKEKLKKKVKKSSESWYCFICDEDRVEDMRKCIVCSHYVHDACVGMTKEDTDDFVCSICS